MHNTSNPTRDAMRLLEKAISEYQTTIATNTESAIRDLLTDLRHICDQRIIDFDDCLEGSLDAYFQEQKDIGGDDDA